MMGSSFRHQRRNIDDRMTLDAHDAPIGVELFETLLQARLLDLVQMVCHDERTAIVYHVALDQYLARR